MKIQVGLTGPVGRDSLYDLVRGWGGERNGDSIGPSQPPQIGAGRFTYLLRFVEIC